MIIVGEIANNDINMRWLVSYFYFLYIKIKLFQKLKINITKSN